MSRSDLYGWGLTLVGVALGYLVGGPVGALLVLLIGVVLIVVANMRGEERDAEPEYETIFRSGIPVFASALPKANDPEPPEPKSDDLVVGWGIRSKVNAIPV